MAFGAQNFARWHAKRRDGVYQPRIDEFRWRTLFFLQLENINA